MSLSRFHDEVVAQHNVTSIYHVVGKSRSREHGAWLPPSRGWGVLIDLLNLCVNSLRSFLPDQPMELALKTLHELLDVRIPSYTQLHRLYSRLAAPCSRGEFRSTVFIYSTRAGE
jgi:hypothetical protein